MTENENYDVVVVDSGAAGLNGALALARSRRSVLVVDAGDPRNAPAGNFTDPQAQVIAAAAGGLMAGAAINFDLVLEEARHRRNATSGRL